MERILKQELIMNIQKISDKIQELIMNIQKISDKIMLN